MAPLEYISAAEAGRRIGVTEKTVRTWIGEGKLSAHHPGGVKNRLAIPVGEVDRMARERSQYQGGEIIGIADLARQIDLLRQELSETKERLAALEEKQRAAPALPADDLWASSEAAPSWSPVGERLRPAATSRRTSEGSEPLPPGAILARAFALQHGVNPATFRDHMTTGIRGDILHVSERPKPSRSRETERYLLPEQQQQAFEFWRRHDVPFTLPSLASEQ